MEKQLYTTAEKEHDLFQNDDIYKSPQEKFIMEHVTHQPFKLKNFCIETSINSKYSILFAILSHCEHYKVPLPKVVEEKKTLKEKVLVVRKLLQNYWDHILKLDQEQDKIDHQEVKKTKDRIRLIKNPIKGLGIDTQEAYFLARILHLRIYVYDHDGKSWQENSTSYTKPLPGGGIYYYKEHVNSNLFLYCRSNGIFDRIYPKFLKDEPTSPPYAMKKESKAKKALPTKKGVTTLDMLKKENRKKRKAVEKAKKEQQKAKIKQEKLKKKAPPSA